MNKYFNKQTVMSFILGGIMFSSVGIFAATEIYEAQKATFNVLVNGETFTSDKPTVVIEGSTYLPLKDTGEALGVDVDWNSENKCVEIKNNNSLNSSNLETLIITPESTPIVSTEIINEGEVKLVERRPNKTKEGITIYYYDITLNKYNTNSSVAYIKPIQIANSYPKYNIEINNSVGTLYEINEGNEKIVLLENIPTQIIDHFTMIEYNYYINNILPLLK